jgi:hypothetical protein
MWILAQNPVHFLMKIRFVIQRLVSSNISDNFSIILLQMVSIKLLKISSSLVATLEVNQTCNRSNKTNFHKKIHGILGYKPHSFSTVNK